ncbi:MAG: hypothetical protein GX851_05055 [Clostridiales bacterium]|nr:hypothetical protein [Clostridiales bacterium]
MKKKLLKRTVSALLCAVMVVTLLPLGSINVNAKYIGFDEMELLGGGFNLLYGVPLENKVVKNALLASSNEINATVNSSTKTTKTASIITDMSKYFQTETATWNASLDANVRTLFVALDLKSKFTHTNTQVYSGANSSYFSSVDILAESYKYSMNLSGSEESNAEILWENVSTQFYRDLTCQDRNGNYRYVSPATIFNTYGTHMITQYMSGGYASAYTSGVSTASEFKNSTDWSVNGKVNISTNYVLDVTAGVGYESQAENMQGYENTGVVSSSYVQGGNNFTFSPSNNDLNTDVNTWLDSLTKVDPVTNGTTTYILTDDNLRLFPLWDILPAEHATRAAELEYYFNQQADSALLDFYSEFIYKNELQQAPDYTQYANYTWITTAEQLNNVRNDLNEKYFILNDLDMSSYSNWEPIGTEAQPFTGELIGNNIAIKGIKLIAASDENRFKGFIANNAGTIKNIAIKGGIYFSDNQYLAPAELVLNNTGTVEGCNYIADAKYTSASQIPGTLTGYSDNGEVMIDLSQSAQTAVGKTVYIGSDISTLTLKGRAGVLFTGLDFVVNSRNKPLNIILNDFCYSASDNRIALNAAAVSQRITLLSLGSQNRISGGNGSNGASASYSSGNGSNGLNGQPAIQCGHLELLGTAQLRLIGGNGGNGGNGANGTASGDYDIAGGRGGNGGNGGVHASSVVCGNMKNNIYSLRMQDGADGNGGHGGNGADGHIGYTGPNNSWKDGTKNFGTRGGDGGNGGNGGGLTGNGGNGGNGGDGGNYWNTWSSVYRCNGGSGGNGGNGGVGDTYGGGGFGGRAGAIGSAGVGTGFGSVFYDKGDLPEPVSGSNGQSGTYPSAGSGKLPEDVSVNGVVKVPSNRLIDSICWSSRTGLSSITKTDYFVQDLLDSSTYTTNYTYNGVTSPAAAASGRFEFSSAGIATVTLAYNGEYVYYPVRVHERAVDDIEVSGDAPTCFKYGENFLNPVLELLFNFGETRVTGTGYDVDTSAVDWSKPGVYTVSITYGELCITYDITIASVAIAGNVIYGTRYCSSDLADMFFGIGTERYTGLPLSANRYGTGSKVYSWEGNTKTGTYSLVLPGDLNGDSVVDGIDLAISELAMSKNHTLDGCWFNAADVVVDDEIDIFDFQTLQNAAMGLTEL